MNDNLDGIDALRSALVNLDRAQESAASPTASDRMDTAAGAIQDAIEAEKEAIEQ